MRLSSILKESDINDDIRDAVLRLFKAKGKPTRNDLNDLARTLDVSSDDLNAVIIDLLDAFSSKVGRHLDTKDTEVDAAELKRGIEVEHEHTDSDYIARLIALDHLAELPDYYTRLDKMEAEGETE